MTRIARNICSVLVALVFAGLPGLALLAQLSPTSPFFTAGVLKGVAGGGAVDNALIVRYKFDEGSGTSVNDESVNNNDATLSGGVSWVTGKSGTGAALSFDGTDDYLSSGSAITYGANVLTVCAWVKATWPGGGTTYRIWNSSSASQISGTANLFHMFADFATLQSYLTGDTFTARRRDDTPDPSDGTWVHIAAVYDNSTADGEITIYYDGVAQTADVYSTTKTGTSSFSAQILYIASLGGSSQFAAIQMDDFRIYSGALSLTEIEYVRDHPDE